MRKDNVGIDNSCRYNDRVNLSDYLLAFSVPVRRKAERSLYMTFGVSSQMLDCMMIMRSYMSLINRNKIAIDRVVAFSGRARGWKADMYRTIEILISMGIFERIEAVRRGEFTISFSGKGEAIEREYYSKFKEIYKGLHDPGNYSKRWPKRQAA